jgi:hypothetical protein
MEPFRVEVAVLGFGLLAQARTGDAAHLAMGMVANVSCTPRTDRDEVRVPASGDQYFPVAL